MTGEQEILNVVLIKDDWLNCRLSQRGGEGFIAN